MDSVVIEVLEKAGSQDPSIFKPAEQVLKQWETQQGFYTALFNVFSNESLPITIRWMAVIYLKNGIDKYWRKRAPNEISADEKEYLRRGLLAKFNEPINQLAIQLAVVIAKIARYDCPKEWSYLVPTLLESIRDGDTVVQHRALLTFHHVVKALASKRLGADRRIFQDLTSNVFNFILNLWNSYTELFIILISNRADNNQIQEAVEKALLSLRILGKLIINGMNKPSENQNAMLFLKVIFERAKTSLECRKSLVSNGIQMDSHDKFIIHLTKILLGVLEAHPYCYIDLIPASLEFGVYYCFTEAGQELSFERFIIQCLNLIKKILQTAQYKEGKEKDDTNPLTLKAQRLIQEFFTSEILTEICTRLVTHYFVLTPADLEFWNVDPENFGVDDCGESWKYSLRPCTESVFLAVLHQFKDILSHVVVELVQRHHQPVDPNDLRGILLKDAVYNAVGLAGFDLYDEVDFDQWFTTFLKHELEEMSNNYRIIRRRVCWLIGRWTGVKLSAELRPELYNLMVKALSSNEDLGVRLAASEALKLAIDEFQFNIDDFNPFLESAFSRLFCLLKEVNECDTKMRVLYVLSFMIERVGIGMKPHIGSLYVYLPELWQQSENHNMLRCAIVSTLVHLEKALGSDSVLLQDFVIGVVELSCDMNQEGHIYLLEDGLELWLALLENTRSSTPPIMNLFKNMPALLESSSDNLKLCLYIIQAYLLLSPQEFLCDRGLIVIDTLESILGDLRSEGITMTMRMFDLCLKVSPQHGIQFVKPVLIRIFERVYLGNESLKGDEFIMAELTMYFSIIARILLCSRDIFIQIIQELTKKLGQEIKEDIVLVQIIHRYVDHMPLVTQQKKRKLLSLALCSLLDASCPPCILEYFPRIILNIVETLNDIMKISDAGHSVDSLVIDDYHNPSQLEDIGYETEHSQRKRQLVYSDLVHCIALDKFLQNKLDNLRRLRGDEQFDQMMHTIRFDINQQLREYVTI